MTISLTNLIADIEAKIAAANSSTSTDELLKIIKAARAANTIANTYDSAGVMPVDSANVGNVLMSASNNFLYVLDSAGGSWSSITGSGGEGGEGGGGSGYQGTQYGYSTGGRNQSGTRYNTVDKFSFSSDGNATDVGDYIASATTGHGSSSSTAGYVAGGHSPSTNTFLRSINKRTFANDGSETTIGNLSIPSGNGVHKNAGCTSSTHGYSAGGLSPSSTVRDHINKFPFSVDDHATDVGGDLTMDRANTQGISSLTDGYVIGGSNSYTPQSNDIDKFPFATDAAATDIADYSVAIRSYASHNTATHGYTSGGQTPGSYANINKFAFASDTTSASDIGDLTIGRYGAAGTSSTVSGYTAGGGWPARNTIDKFPFSADGNSTDVGDLTQSRYDGIGPTQV
jgi:hypothetical protein